MQSIVVGGPRAVEIPARQIEIPGRMVEIPARQLQITGDDGQPVTIEIPARMIEVPGRIVEVPGQAIDIPDKNGLTVQGTHQHVQAPRALEYYHEVMPQEQQFFAVQPQLQPQRTVVVQHQPAPQPQHVYFEQPLSYEQIYGASSSPQEIIEYVAAPAQQRQTMVQQAPQSYPSTIVVGGNNAPSYQSSPSHSILKKSRPDMKPIYEPAPIDYDINAVRALTSAYNQLNQVRSIDTEGSYNYILEQRQVKDTRKGVRTENRPRQSESFSPRRQWTVGAFRY